MLAGETVGIVVIDTDQLGRTVGVVYLEDVNVNLELVKAGHAWWYRQYAGRDGELRAAEQEARLGLWADAEPVPPWDWRRGKR